MKRRWLIASLTAAAIAVGAFGGTVLAQDATGESGSKGIFARAAGILGIGEKDLKDAFQQAGGEIRDERRNAHIDKLVEDGVITEAEAAELREWLESRPEVVDKLPLGGPHFGRGFHGHRHHFGFRAPRVEGGLLPPDGEIFEQFRALRGQHGFGIMDGHGFMFHWSGPAGGAGGEAEGEMATGSGVNL